LADFQLRATTRILASWPARADRHVVCAGTGSGKDARVLPAGVAAIADSLDGANWVRCLAIYPRNELLKDQFTEAYARRANWMNPRPAWPTQAASRRPVWSDAERADAFESRWPPDGWRRVTGGYVCPLLRCQRCGGDLVWRDIDRRPDGTERLRCAADDRHPTVESDEVIPRATACDSRRRTCCSPRPRC